MFKLSLRYELTFPNALFMTILFIGLCFFIGWLWQRYGKKQYLSFVINSSMGLFAVIFIIGMIFGKAPDHDEIEHAHATWLMFKGLDPFIDFFQHHSPALWILLAPLYKSSLFTENLCVMIRIIATGCTLVSIFFLTLITKYIWQGKKVVLYMLIFVMSICISHEMFLFRPDVFCNIFNLAAFYFLLTKHQKFWACFAAGLCFGISLSFSPKYLPLIAALPLMSVVDYKKFLYFLPRNFIYLAGILAGLTPLVIWLKAHQLVQPFLEWVFQFNLREGLIPKTIGMNFNFLLLIFTLTGIYFLITSPDQKIKQSGRILCTFLIVSALVYLKPSQRHYEYYEQMFVLVSCVVAAGALLIVSNRWLAGKKNIFLLVIIGLLIWPGLHRIQFELKSKNFIKLNNLIKQLKTIAQKETIICHPALHPVTNFDALDITNGWEYRFWLSYPEIRARLGKNVVEKIITGNPAIIMNKPEDIGIVCQLEKNKIINTDQASQLANFLTSNYHLTFFDYHQMWIRNDRYEWYQSHIKSSPQ